MGLLSFVAFAVAAAFAAQIYLNKRDPTLAFQIPIIDSNDVVEEHLRPFKEVIGDDYAGYRNHIYRVMTYAMHYLGNDKKHLDQIAIGLVYHDIGLWTDKNLAYLEPSVAQAEKDLSGKLSASDMQLIKDIIYWHHKITPFESVGADVVNAVRMADWIDATEGLVHQGMPASNIASVTDLIPDEGFHKTLQTIGTRYYGDDYFRIVKDTVSILKW